MTDNAAKLITDLMMDNRDFIKKSVEAKKEIKALAESIQKEFGGSMAEAQNIARRSLQNTQKEIAATRKEASLLGDSFGALKTAFIAFASVETFRRVAESVDKLAASASKFDLPVEEFQMFQYAAKRADTDIGTFESGLQKLRSTLADAAAGGKEARAAFLNLGLDPKKLATMNAGDAYKQISSQLQGMSSQDQVGAVNEIFGKKAGQEQLLMLRSLAESTREYKQLDIGLTKEQIEIHEKLDKAMDKQMAIAGNSLKQAYINLAPAINTATDALASFIKTGGGLGTVYDMVSGQFQSDMDKTLNKGVDLNAYKQRHTNGYSAGFQGRVQMATGAKVAGDVGAAQGNSVSAALSSIVPAVVTAREKFVDLSQTITDFKMKAGAIVNVQSDLRLRMGELAIATGAAGTALKTFKDGTLKDLLGLNNKGEGKDYLSGILKKPKQIEDSNFNDIAQGIRDELAKTDGKMTPGNESYIKNQIEKLDGLAKSAEQFFNPASERYKKSGNEDDLMRVKGDEKSDYSTSGMFAAIKELRDATTGIKQDNTVKIEVSVKNNEFIQAVVTNNKFSKAVVDIAVEAADSSAREAMR